MHICEECKNKGICKWIPEQIKLQDKLDKIATKEGSPFNLTCNCKSFATEEKVIEKEEVVLEEVIEQEQDQEIKEEV